MYIILIINVYPYSVIDIKWRFLWGKKKLIICLSIINDKIILMPQRKYTIIVVVF